MATTTTNFGWDIPQSTDLVKDGATAIAALGQDIDTALVDLKGGTTGQILSKASNTDLDYSWITNDVGDITAVTAGTGISGGGTSGSVTVTNSMATAIDAKGDLIGGTGADTFSRLAVGANGTVLTADSAEATGLKWAAGGGGLVLLNTTTFSAVASQSVNSVFSSTYANYKIMIELTATSLNATGINLRFRASGSDTTTNYKSYLVTPLDNNWTTGSPVTSVSTTNIVAGYRHRTVNESASWLEIFSPFATKNTLTSGGYMSTGTTSEGNGGTLSGILLDSTSYDGFTLIASQGTMTGTVRIYGYGN